MQQEKIDIVRFDDWMALYINGNLVYENHRIEATDLLNALGLTYRVFEITDPNVYHLPEFSSELEEYQHEQRLYSRNDGRNSTKDEPAAT